MHERGRLAAVQRASTLASIQSKNSASAIAPVLMTSAMPAASSRSGSVASAPISATTLRLVERADHVLAERMIDARLAADRRIDLRQQRRGHLDERHAAHVAGGRETGHVADHAAAECDQRRLAIGTLGEQPVEDQVERFPVLVGLAVRRTTVDARPSGASAARSARRTADRRSCS
jgi:hypothetical protein